MVDISLTTRHQVEDKDAPVEIPGRRTQAERKMINGWDGSNAWEEQRKYCRVKDTNLNTIPTSRQGTTSYISHT